MIVLKADKELNLTFQKLIKMMDAPVEWNGMFFVIGDYLILQGSVRSLFFNFDTKLVVTNIIELSAENQKVVAVEEHPNVRDILNMVLYAFGKWGNIRGLRVDRDYVQLNRLFAQILGEFQVESQYGQEHFRFYKNKIRLTYEDVIESVLSEEPEEIFIPEEEEPQGLWHKLIWKKAASSFLMKDTTIAERRRNRIGNNFYLAGYLCPKCGSQLYMAVYPEGKEFQIETEEGAVRIARVYSCKKCCCMYTPRPKRLLVDGDVYKMDFERDEAAYEDYQELLGRTAGRNVNTKYNEYVDKKMQMQVESAETAASQDEEAEITELIAHLPEISEQELFRTMRKMEEGFYSDEGVRRLEKAIRGGEEEDNAADIVREDADGEEKTAGEEKKNDKTGLAEVERKAGEGKAAEERMKAGERRATEAGEKAKEGRAAEERMKAEASRVVGAESAGKNAGKSERMESNELETTTDSAIEKNRNKPERETKRTVETKSGELGKAAKIEKKRRVGRTEEASSGDVEKNWKESEEKRITRKSIEAGQAASKGTTEKSKEESVKKAEESAEKAEKIEGGKLKETTRVERERSTGRTAEGKDRESEESERTAKTQERSRREPETVRERKSRPVEVLKNPEADRQSHQEELKRLTKVQRLVNQPGRRTREDLVSLLDEIKKENLSPEIVQPYIGQVEDRIRSMDEKQIKEICKNVGSMDFEDASDAVKKLEEGNFLPQLKFDALKELEQRMSKIKTDECELLVNKLFNAFDEAGVTESERYHFYPAKRVWQKQAEPEETAVFTCAEDNFANGIGKFEYPLLMIDKSKDESGKEGVLLTPENLYFSAWMTSYYISVMDIASVEASTGLLNRGIYVHQNNGSRTKLPLAVEHADLEKFAKVMEDFTRYLQEKPFSRKESYLAKEKHDTICCYRCGYIYKGAGVCPRCGYKQNE